MDIPSVVEILKELLSVEQRRLSIRLVESNLFVSRLSAENLRVVQRMAQESAEHCAWLVDLIIGLGGFPSPRPADVTTADLHYQTIERVFPRLIFDHEALIEAFAIGAERVAEQPEAAGVVRHILQRHRDDLVELKRLAGEDTGETAG